MIRLASRFWDSLEILAASAILGVAKMMLHLTLSVFLRGFMGRRAARYLMRLAIKIQRLSSRLMLRQIKRIKRRLPRLDS